MSNHNDVGKMSECCTCGAKWLTGQDGSHSCSRKLKEANDALTARVTDLTAALSGLMAANGGGVKSCGHDFTCICADDQARKALEGVDDD